MPEIKVSWSDAADGKSVQHVQIHCDDKQKVAPMAAALSLLRVELRSRTERKLIDQRFPEGSDKIQPFIENLRMCDISG